MYETREYFNEKFYQILISEEIINFSYPNKNYSQLANNRFEYSMSQIKSKFSNQLEQLLKTSKNPLFINAHGGKKGEAWVIYNTEVEHFEINDFLERQIEKFNVDSCILYVCNSKNLELKINSIPILYPNQKISSIIKSNETFNLINSNKNQN